jgi:hypothetical protein
MAGRNGKNDKDNRTPDHAKRRANHAGIDWCKWEIDEIDIEATRNPHWAPICCSGPAKHVEKGWHCPTCDTFRAYPSEARQRKIERTILNVATTQE